jgi:hypothetical protein
MILWAVLELVFGACYDEHGRKSLFWKARFEVEKNNRLTRGLALCGTALIWFPLIAPILLGLVALFGEQRRFLLDFLMPAELFTLSVFGFGLLLWAAFRAHTHQKLIGWGFVAALALLMLSQAIAVLTGLASGETEATTQMITLVMIPYVLYIVSMVASSFGGAWLTYDLYHQPKATGA